MDTSEDTLMSGRDSGLIGPVKVDTGTPDLLQTMLPCDGVGAKILSQCVCRLDCLRRRLLWWRYRPELHILRALHTDQSISCCCGGRLYPSWATWLRLHTPARWTIWRAQAVLQWHRRWARSRAVSLTLSRGCSVSLLAAASSTWNPAVHCAGLLHPLIAF